MKIVCVYKTGGDFDGEYVEALYNSIRPSLYGFVCMTDADDVPSHIPQIPLNHNLDGWWSKMEMFDPKNPYIGPFDILYFDLDTVLIDDIDEMFGVCNNTQDDNVIMLKDFYFPDRFASGIMYIPHKHKGIIWANFMRAPELQMSDHRGDQNYLEETIRMYKIPVKTWQDYLANYIASYKTHITKNYPKHLKPLEVDVTKSKVICYHGKPRPKDTRLFYEKGERYHVQ
jgi:hypothetical protein